jgi:hypothetical protein
MPLSIAASATGFVRAEAAGTSRGPDDMEAVIMGIGISVFLLAVGAILAFAVNVTTSGVNLDTVGVILMVVGALGLLLSMLFWSSFAPFAGGRRETYVRDERI